jgi:hypothetical protein
MVWEEMRSMGHQYKKLGVNGEKTPTLPMLVANSEPTFDKGMQ